jgi:deoxycytidylate deaminase
MSQVHAYKIHQLFDYIRGHCEYSNDPVTKTAAVAVCERGDVRAIRANFIDHGAPETLSREARLEVSYHSERNVIHECENSGVQPHTVLTLGTPCYNCVKTMADAGVTRIIIDHDNDPFRDRLDDPKYAFAEAAALAEERGVELIRCSVIDDPDLARSTIGTG